jgi:hypothetical protein
LSQLLLLVADSRIPPITHHDARICKPQYPAISGEPEAKRYLAARVPSSAAAILAQI